MTVVVTLTDYAPVQRFDGAPWIRARIEEAPDEEGPFTEIDLIDLSPVDDDPENPAVRSFTSDNASGTDLWYRVAWVDAQLHESLTTPVQNVDTTLEYQPPVADVAAEIWSRTRDANGREQGNFTADTRPTYEQALRITVKATTDVAASIGFDIPDRMIESARNTITLLAASRIERSFFADQITAGRSPYGALYAEYQASLKELSRSVEIAAEEDGLLDEFGAAGMPAFSFPPLGPVPHVPGAECPIDTYGLDW